MKRRDEREQAFSYIFELNFNENNEVTEDSLTSAVQSREENLSEFAKKIILGVFEKKSEIEDIISKTSSNWNTNRISKVSKAILYICIFEMLYVEDVSASVSINEAVEIAKKYEGQQCASFVNGVLGTVSRTYLKEN